MKQSDFKLDFIAGYIIVYPVKDYRRNQWKNLFLFRICIGNDAFKDHRGNYVFSKFDEQELTLLRKIIKPAADVSMSLCLIGIERRTFSTIS